MRRPRKILPRAGTWSPRAMEIEIREGPRLRAAERPHPLYNLEHLDPKMLHQRLALEFRRPQRSSPGSR